MKKSITMDEAVARFPGLKYQISQASPVRRDGEHNIWHLFIYDAENTAWVFDSVVRYGDDVFEAIEVEPVVDAVDAITSTDPAVATAEQVATVKWAIWHGLAADAYTWHEAAKSAIHEREERGRAQVMQKLAAEKEEKARAGLAKAVAWTSDRGVCPEVRITYTNRITGSGRSEDERGERAEGYTTHTVVVLDHSGAEIATWVAGTTFLGDAPDYARPVIAACWTALEGSTPLPHEAVETVLAEPRDWLRPGGERRDTRRLSLVLVRGPSGRYVEARFTFPHHSRSPEQVFTARVVEASLVASKAVAGEWGVVEFSQPGWRRTQMGRITGQEADAVRAALAARA